MERTFKFTQEQIAASVDVATSRKVWPQAQRPSCRDHVQIFDLKFDHFGPYSISYTRNGRYACMHARVLGGT